MLKIIAQKRHIPAVGSGVGRAASHWPSWTDALDVPWSYAALEHGLESVPGQPTVSDLKEIYAWDDIGPKTRFVGLVGRSTGKRPSSPRVLNAAFRKGGRSPPLPARADPIVRPVGRATRTTQDPSRCWSTPIWLPSAAETVPNKGEGSAEPSGYADLLLHQTGWMDRLQYAVAACGRRRGERLGKKDESDHPL